MIGALANRETGQACRDVLVNPDVVDTRASRAAAQLGFETVDRLEVPFGRDLDRSVVAIGDPTTHPLAQGGFLCKVPEPHALHAALQDETTSHEHATVYSSAVRRLTVKVQTGHLEHL